MSLGEDKCLATTIKELDIFLGRNYVVTFHDEPITSMEDAWDACHRDKRYRSHGPDHLLYKIIDDLVADYWPMVEKIDQEIDHLEDQIFTRPEPKMLERKFALKRAPVAVRHITAPQREVLNRLACDEFEVVDARDRIFFRDIYDHLVRLHDLNESMRDLVSGALDAYLSVINNRMNEAMRTLTVITTLFMPLSFIVGFFGMNFFLPQTPISEWMVRPVFYVIIVLIASTPIVMYRWMRSRTWI
jgi:magnesium transporter